VRVALILVAASACAHVPQVECADLTLDSAPRLVGQKIALHGRLGAGREGGGMCVDEQQAARHMVLTLVAIDNWPKEWDPAITPLVDDGKMLEVIACGVLRDERRSGFPYVLTMDRDCSRALESLPGSPRGR
jgi:hypothetical protein